MKKLLLFVLAATALAACSTDTTQDLAPEIPTAPDELQVSFDEEDTRIQLQNNVAVWTEGDLVSVFYRSNANDKWQFQGKTGDTAGTLKRIEATTATQATTKIVAVYPYSKDYWFNWNTGDVEASLPAEQTYLKDSFGLDGTIMVSQSDYNQLSFKNVCGWLKIQLTGDAEAIKSITLRGNNGEQVAGEVYINSDDASCILAAEMGVGEEGGTGGAGGTLIFDDTILTSVTLNCGDGVALNSETPTAFYVALPPQTFEKGFTLEITDNTDFTMSQSTEKMVVIERNHILPMSPLEFINPNTPATPTPATNEIWYTATAKVEPVWSDAVAFGANAVSNVFDNDTKKGIITFDGDVTMIGDKAFETCQALKSVTIPNNVTTIGERAFYNCDALTSVTIGDGVTSIGDSAFADSTSLTSLTIGNGVTTIGERAFAYCYALTSVTIPDSVTTIGDSAFYNCRALKAFYGKFASADNRCLIVDGVLKSFAIGCGLTEYTIPDSVTTIGGAAFAYCDALTSVTIPDSVTTIGDYAFEWCGALKSITIPDSVTTIGREAFATCTALTSATIPDSVTTIGYAAFVHCYALKEVYCKPTTPPSLGGSWGRSSVFDGNASGRRIYIPAASVDAYKAAEGWSEYASAIYPYTFTE